MVLGDLLAIILAIAVIVATYYKWSYSYWKRRKLPFLEPRFPYGNIEGPIRPSRSMGTWMKDSYDEMKRKGWNHGGVYIMTIPNYIPLKLDYVKNILTKDFNHFTDRGFYYNEKDDPLSAHLFAIGGAKWRNLRTKITPTFTSGKMKAMFQTLVDCEVSLQEVMQKNCNKKEPVDIKEVLGCFTTDIIGSCAFGLDCNTFKNDDSPFRRYGKKFFNPSNYRSVLNLFAFGFPETAKMLGVRQIDKDISEFFRKVVSDTVEFREKNNVTRKDFLQLLMELMHNNSDEYNHDGKALSIEEVAAQCFIFFLAGFETSSTTSTFALYELAKNHDLQGKVRAEIKAVLAKNSGKITYDSINEMKYMNQVIDETLRKYPPLPFITRVCVQDYRIPEEDFVIEKGTDVVIPIIGIHHDPDYYPDPEVFDPDRFSEENKKNRNQYAHIPFGEGPRICIGLRFGVMQSKVALTSLLRDYEFSVSNKMNKEFKFNVQSFILATEGEVWLDAEKIAH